MPSTEQNKSERSKAAKTIQAHKLLEEHYKPVKGQHAEDRNYHQYEKGWDDDKVAKLCSLPLHYVANMRVEVFGPMPPSVKPHISLPAAISRIGKIEETLERMTQDHKSLVSMQNRMEEIETMILNMGEEHGKLLEAIERNNQRIVDLKLQLNHTDKGKK